MRKAILKVALSSILALSVVSANSLVNILKDSQDPTVQSLAQYQNDNSLYFKDAYGFTLYDYALTKNNAGIIDWLKQNNIKSGVTPELVQRAQVWLYLLSYPVDNLEGNFNSAFQDNILHYQTVNNLPVTSHITPEWFIDLEHDAITSVLKEIEKQNPSLSEVALQAELIQSLQARLPDSIVISQLINAGNILNASNNKVLFEITPKNAGQVPYEMLLELNFLEPTKKSTATSSVLPQTHLTHFFNFSANEIKKLTANPRSAKTLTLQSWLKIAGFFPSPLIIDGQRGANTRTAISHFQESIGQKPDGIPNAQWETPLEEIVRQSVQQQLTLLGLYHGKIDGKNSAAIRNAIRRFEKSHSLPETGTLSPIVLFHLFNPQFLPEKPVVVPTAIEEAVVEATTSTEQSGLQLTIAADTPPNTSSIEPINNDDNVEVETTTSQAVAQATVSPIIQKTVSTIIEGQAEAEKAQQVAIIAAEKAAEESAKKAARAAEKAEQVAKIKSLLERDQPVQLFSLTRAEMDHLIIKAKRPDIFFTQVSLHLLDLYDGDIDGANGPATRTAIRAFEKALGQPETGQVLPRWQTPLRQIMYRMVQTHLKEIGIYKGDVDGITGPGTRQAIIAYEKANNTEAVGRLTPALLLSLFNSNKDIQQPIINSGNDIPSDSPDDVTDDGTSPVSAEEDQELKSDSNKSEEKLRTSVKQFDLSHTKSTEETALLQLQLAYLGFYKGTVDGLTGPGTNRAVSAFQSAYQLPVNGKMDNRTQSTLETENINKFQRYLQRTDYMKDAPTGKLGPKTRRAIGILKNRYGYQVNDTLDIPAFLILIDEEQGSTLAKTYFDQVIKAREAEASIKDTQAYLIGFGVLSGKADGLMGPATERAISTYRSQQGLKKGNQIDRDLLESFKKASPKQAQAYLQQLGYPIKPDGIFGANSKKQLNAFLTSQRQAKSETVTPDILMRLKAAIDVKLTSGNSGNRATQSAAPQRRTGAAPNLQKGLQAEGILSNAPTRTVNGPLQVIKNNNGAVVGCKVKNITMAADWCSGKKNGSSCRVLYKNGRVLSMNCR